MLLLALEVSSIEDELNYAPEEVTRTQLRDTHH